MQSKTLSKDDLKRIIYPNRYDIAIKHAYIKSIHDDLSNQQLDKLYEWTIHNRTRGREPGNNTKTSIIHYKEACKTLLISMRKHGFTSSYPIKLDASYRPHGGSHRLATSLVLLINPVFIFKDFTKNPRSWGLDWYKTKRALANDIVLLQRLMDNLLITIDQHY